MLVGYANDYEFGELGQFDTAHSAACRLFWRTTMWRVYVTKYLPISQIYQIARQIKPLRDGDIQTCAHRL